MMVIQYFEFYLFFKKGKVFALDVSDEFTTLARKYWKLANVEHKVHLTFVLPFCLLISLKRLAPAVETLDKFIADGQSGTFDFAFIDADKPNYINYYERSLVLLRKGGLICIDNVLWAGKVADPNVKDENTAIIRKLNEFIHKDERVDISMIGIGTFYFILKKIIFLKRRWIVLS
jgi:predicted O-methyltransferase YrrM